MTDKSREFVAEAEELLDEASASLIEMQETLPGPDPDIVNSVFRVMHTLKGMSGLFGFQAFSDISHHLENILDLIRLGKAEITLEVTGLLFRQMDRLKAMLTLIRKNIEIDVDSVESSINEIKSFMAGISEVSQQEFNVPFPGRYRHLLKVLSEYEEHRLRANINNGNSVYLLETSYPIEEFDVLLKELVDRIKPFGEVVSTMPVSEGVSSGSIGFHILVASSRGQAEFEEMSGTKPVLLVDSGRVDTAGGPDAGYLPEAEQSLRSLSATVRVDISKIDSMLDSISDLSLSRQAVANIWSEFVQEHGNTPLSVDLYRVAQTMHRKLSLLQSQVLEIRMVPVRQIFSRLARIVKRHSADAGRVINLEMYGEDTEIDKYIAEEIVDPLMHLVRNAIDHGIESEEERAGAEKPERGTLKLSALQRGNNVIISVKDDGRGISPDSIRERALSKGIISDHEALDRREILDLIFIPGFSTSPEVSVTSGRGVGLDVVKDRIAFLGGAIEVSGEEGEGTTFTLLLPITLAMIRALLVSVDDEIFAIPLTSMSETFVAEKDELQEVEGGLVYNFRGEMLPLAHLGGLLELSSEQRERCFIVIMGHGDRRTGFLVDGFLGQQELVIKPLGGYFEGIKGYAGATEIGRHKVVLVLDTETLISEAMNKRKSVAG